MTVAESEHLVPPLPGAKTKNLFLRDRKGTHHFLLTVPHALAVDLNALGEALAAARRPSSKVWEAIGLFRVLGRSCSSRSICNSELTRRVRILHLPGLRGEANGQSPESRGASRQRV